MAVSRWYVYVLQSTNRTYVGIALDIEKRLQQHNGELRGGAKSTRAGRPWRVSVTHGPFRSRAKAQRIEYAIKQRRGQERLLTTVPKLPRR
jgi:putative endonuclease